MDFILDNQETENKYQQLLRQIRLRQCGDIAASMKRQGMAYKKNWGVPLVDIRELARDFEPDHLLALKLWNKQWRETMILATLLDEPEKVTEEQMDFWTKGFESIEIAEQASANLWVRTKFAFVKALEWSRGKKHLVRYTGIHLMGRLIMTSREAIDEMFEPFFGELAVLGRDSRLNTVIYRTVIALGTRSELLNEKAVELAQTYRMCEQKDTVTLGNLLYDELNAGCVK